MRVVEVETGGESAIADGRERERENKKNEEKERKRTPQERANEMKTAGEREGDRLFLNLNRKTMVKRRGRR